jgi:hypothetical protein
LLSPPPEESMSQGRLLRERKKIEFRPTDPKAEETSFGNASDWGRKQLKMLGVLFAPNARKRLDLKRIVDMKERWPPHIEQSSIP